MEDVRVSMKRADVSNESFEKAIKEKESEIAELKKQLEEAEAERGGMVKSLGEKENELEYV